MDFLNAQVHQDNGRDHDGKDRQQERDETGLVLFDVFHAMIDYSHNCQEQK